ncbi:hypothetical protein ACODT5_30370 [Streptomyces sp. 5.8]|uniref:hypothetical protein n=1 Tax=Streptomyces sp. 5.8 TaxID=3406571 RepID=UPI003BB71EE1
MIRLKKAAAAALATGTLVTVGLGVSAGSAQASEVEPLHVVTCSWIKSPPPWAPDATSVRGFAEVRCSSARDKSRTHATIQIFRDGGWHDQGPTSTSYNKGTTVHVNANATKRIGDWLYRVKGDYAGQHGNWFQLPTYYSQPRNLWRRG